MKHHKNAELVEEIRLCKKAGLAAKLGRGSSATFRKDWDEVRDDVMMQVLRWKFT